MLETIVVREPNAQLPEAFSKMLLEKHPTAFCYASPQGESHIESEPFPGEDVDLEDALKKVEESYKKDRIYYYFVQAGEDEINFESLQPFDLMVDDEKRALLSVILAGDFPEYEGKNEDGEAYTPAYHCMNSFLKDLIAKMVDIVGNDVSMVMAALDKKAQRDQLNAVLGPNATILLIPNKGKSMAITNNKEAGQWKWGFSTNKMGYEEAAGAAAATSTTIGTGKKLSMREQAELRAKKTDAPAEHPPGGTVTKPEELYAPLLKDSRFKLGDNNVLMVGPPKGSNWKEAKTFWNTHCKLERPSDPGPLYLGFPADELRANSPLNDLRARLMGEKPAKAESVQGPAEPDKEKKEAKKDVAGMTLLIPTDKKKKYLESKKLKKYETATEAELTAMLKEYPLCSIDLGENFDEMLWWKPTSIARFVHDSPGSHAAICLIHELRCRLLGLVDTAGKVVEDEETKPVEEAPAKKLTMKERAELRAAGKAA